MKAKFFTVAGAMAFAASIVISGVSLNKAEAQGKGAAPVILVIDQAAVVAGSKAGQSIKPQLETIGSGIGKELEAEFERFKGEVEAFQKSAELMSDDVRNQKARELQAKQNALPQQEQIMSQAVQIAARNAQGKILQQAQPIWNDIVDKRKGTILIERSAVVNVSKEIDITSEVITQLDKKFKTVDVQKISLAEVKKQITEQAAKAQEAQKGKK